MNMRSAVVWLGLMLLAMPSARAVAEESSPASDAAAVGFAEPVLPEPPEVVVAVSPSPVSGAAHQVDISSAEPAIPEVPTAFVVIPAADAIRGAIELRLRDVRLSWPQRLPKKDREAVAAFYGAHGWRPLWTAEGGLGLGGRKVADVLARAAEDGLDPAEYAVFATSPRPTAPAAELADTDIRLSAAAALYAHDARGGRLDPTRLSSLITPKLDLPPADAVLAGLAEGRDPGAILERYNPVHAGFGALKAKLADLRAHRMPNPVPMARRNPDLTTQAIASLDDPPLVRPSPYSDPHLEGDIIANMERWRWLPAEIGDRYVAVNIPEFRLRLYEGGRVVHEARVVTGKPETPTPIFSGVMEYAIVNPSWYVPPSILKKEFLPRMAEDPDYAARQGYEVVRRGRSISIRQPPGEKNALGFIKFMFPNQHAVYLHDTPSRRLFGQTRRAFSHGCVRVDQPFALADFVLGSAWSEARLKRLIGKGERTIWLPQKLPVHLTYFTVSVDEAGELRRFEDIYGHNRRVRTALGL